MLLLLTNPVQEDRRTEKKTGCGDQGLREGAQKSKNRFRPAWWFGLQPRAQGVCAKRWGEEYSLRKTSLLHPHDHLNDHLKDMTHALKSKQGWVELENKYV